MKLHWLASLALSHGKEKEPFGNPMIGELFEIMVSNRLKIILVYNLKNSYGDYRYVDLGKRMTFSQAEAQCKKIGGRLPIPRSGMI